MLRSRIVRDYIIVSACMLALASTSSVSERQAITPADAIGGENAEELECVVCMVELENEELFICGAIHQHKIAFSKIIQM